MSETSTAPVQKDQKQEKETLPESIASFAAVFVSGLFIITFLIQHFEIPSRSMEQTLLVGDHVFVDRLTPTGNQFPAPLMPYRQLHRGDTAVFVSPAEPGLYLVKRIIAVPGDRIHLENRKVFLNGVEQNEPYVYYNLESPDHRPDPYRDNFPSISPFGRALPRWSMDLPKYMQGRDVVVPPGHYFAMGDNRDVSYDSRYWGFVPEENVMGRPLFIAWSLNQTEADFEPRSLPERVVSFVRTAARFFVLTRWSRVMRLVR